MSEYCLCIVLLFRWETVSPCEVQTSLELYIAQIGLELMEILLLQQDK